MTTTQSIDPLAIAELIKYGNKQKIENLLESYNLSTTRINLIKQSLQNANLVNFMRYGVVDVNPVSFRVSAAASEIRKAFSLVAYVASDSLVETLHLIPNHWVSLKDLESLYLDYYPNKGKVTISKNLKSLDKLGKIKLNSFDQVKKIEDFIWEEVQTIPEDKFNEITSKEVRELEKLEEKKSEDLPLDKTEEKIFRSLAKLRSAGKIKYSLVQFLLDQKCSYAQYIAKLLKDNNHIYEDGNGYIEFSSKSKDLSLTQLAKDLLKEHKESNSYYTPKAKPEKVKNNIEKRKSKKEKVISIKGSTHVSNRFLFDLISEVVMASEVKDKNLKKRIGKLLEKRSLTKEFKTYLLENQFDFLED